MCASLKFVEEGAWLGVKNQVFELFKQGLVLQPEKTLNRFLSLQAMGSETVKSDVVTIKALLKNSPKPKPLALISGLTLLNDVDLRVQFGELTMPCLSVFGSKDTLIPVNNVLAVKRINPLAEQVIFKKSAHAPFISEPNLFVDTLIDFIGKVD